MAFYYYNQLTLKNLTCREHERPSPSTLRLSFDWATEASYFPRQTATGKYNYCILKRKAHCERKAHCTFFARKPRLRPSAHVMRHWRVTKTKLTASYFLACPIHRKEKYGMQQGLTCFGSSTESHYIVHETTIASGIDYIVIPMVETKVHGCQNKDPFFQTKATKKLKDIFSQYLQQFCQNSLFILPLIIFCIIHLCLTIRLCAAFFCGDICVTFLPKEQICVHFSKFWSICEKNYLQKVMYPFFWKKICLSVFCHFCQIVCVLVFKYPPTYVENIRICTKIEIIILGPRQHLLGKLGHIEKNNLEKNLRKSWHYCPWIPEKKITL